MIESKLKTWFIRGICSETRHFCLRHNTVEQTHQDWLRFPDTPSRPVHGIHGDIWPPTNNKPTNHVHHFYNKIHLTSLDSERF